MTEQEKLFSDIKKSFSDLGMKVICDSTNNTQEDIDNNVLNVSIIPAPSVQRIVINLEVPKIVLCYRCLKAYDILKAPLTKTKRLREKEPECPHCGCRVYFS